MTPTIYPRDHVARQLAVPVTMLRVTRPPGSSAWCGRGDVEGYGPAEIRRVWTIVSCQRDLGINLAGVEAVLKLRDHLTDVHRHLDLLATRLRQALDEQDEAATHEHLNPPKSRLRQLLERPEARQPLRRAFEPAPRHLDCVHRCHRDPGDLAPRVGDA